MEKAPLGLQRYICRSCLSTFRRPHATQALRLALSSKICPNRPAARPVSSKAHDTNPARPTTRLKSTASVRRVQNTQDASNELRSIEKQIETTLGQHNVPSDQETLEVLRAIEATARRLVGHHDPDRDAPNSSKDNADRDSPTSAILSLGSRPSKSTAQQQHQRTPAHRKDAIDTLSNLAYTFLTHPRVFISSSALISYITTQSHLQRPSTFPKIFDAFANKPIPTLSKHPATAPTFRPASPNALAAAIPPKVADLALTTAIQTRDLPLALSIISTTYRLPAHRRSKIFRQALLPILGASLTPFAAYSLATQLSTLQTGLPPEMFTQLAFAGLGTYALAVGTIGYVAVTSANDQMRRVTWAVGMPLWERWVREEERAGVERCAVAWGLGESWRWGEEEGVVWEGLREWVGVRGMVLDKVGLMEGME